VKKLKGSAPPTIGVHDYSRTPAPAASLGWWPEKMDERGAAMVAIAKQIEASPQEMERNDLNLLYGSCYEGKALTSLYQYGGAAVLSQAGALSLSTSDVTWNQVRSVVQTVSSQVSRTKPRARFITTGGNYRQKRRAKKLTLYCDGLFQEAKAYEKTQQVFVDAGVFDVGAIQVYRDGDRVRMARILACEILVDANDAIYGSPRSMYRRRFIDRSQLLARFKDPAAQDAIKRATAADPVGQGGQAALIEVYEGWHLPSVPKAKDGRHVIAIAGMGGTLLDEVYERDYFPIILFTWDKSLAGAYGRSAAEVLLPNQTAINGLLDKIARAQHLACVPRVGIQRGSKVLKSEITNGIGSVIQFGTMPPVWWSPTALSPEVYQHLERHWSKGFELYGVSADTASGRKEAGVTSGTAIRESLDIQTARFAVLAQRWEQLHLDVARAAIDIARDIYLDNQEMQVSAPGTSLLETIDWKDVDMEEDAYVIQGYPTSLLPTTPQGRIDRVTDLVDRGIWSAKRAEAALDDLDVDSAMNSSRAAEKDIERICDDILTDGKYDGPEPTMDLDACLRIGGQYLSIGRIEKAEPKHLDKLYRWLDDAAELKKKIAPPPAPAAPAPALPAAAPMAVAA
jgi:Bacteriophage head to tail connecting protein